MEDGHPPLRPGSTAAATTPWRAPSRCTRPTTTSTTRTRSGRRGRPLRRSPAYGALAELGCEFGEKSGWERPNWFTPNEAAGDPGTRPRRAGPGSTGARPSGPRRWRAGTPWPLFDETSFSKMEVAGAGAATFLERVCANEVDRPVGTVTYTQLLQRPRRHRVRPHRHPARRGPLPARHRHRVREPRSGLDPQAGRAAARGRRPCARDVTAAWACFGLWGPAARDVLQPLTRTTLANEAFPYLTARPSSLGAVPVLAVRVTYVGELGWELYCPTEYGATLWDAALGRG